MPPEDLDLQVEETQPQTPAEPSEKLLGKYDTVDDLGNAYKHLESRFGQQGSELSTERAAREAAEARAVELEGLVAQQPQQPQYGIENNPIVQYAQDKLMEGDIGPFLNLTADIASAKAAELLGQQPKPEAPQTPQDFDAVAFTAEQQVWQRHGQAYADLRDEVSQKIEEDPSLVTGPSFKEIERGLDMAFRLVQRDHLLAGQAKAAQQEEERQKSLDMKRAAQTATGAGPRPVPKSEQEQTWEAIKNAPRGGFSTA